MAKSLTLTLFVQLVKHVPERIIADAVAKRQTDYRSKGVRHADARGCKVFCVQAITALP